MQFQYNFDLNDILAYVLPGCLLLLAVHYALDPQISKVFAREIQVINAFGGFLGIVLFFSASLAAGHICSVWTRWIMRPLIRKLAHNTRMSIFDRTPHSFYSTDLKKAIAARFTALFSISLDDLVNLPAAPRMIRTHVLATRPTTALARERIVRARSLCGNFCLPLLLLAVQLAVKGHFLLAALGLAASGLLVIKQVDLDVREWREIYVAFVEEGRP